MAQDLYSNIKEWKLGNGTDVITYNKTTSNICSINIGFKLPISVENDKNIGLRNLLIKVMTRNTLNYQKPLRMLVQEYTRLSVRII